MTKLRPISEWVMLERWYLIDLLILNHFSLAEQTEWHLGDRMTDRDNKAVSGIKESHDYWQKIKNKSD